MKQTRYNYHGRPVGGELAYEAEVERLRRTPTEKQKHFVRFLCAKLRAAGLDPWDGYHHPVASRTEYADAIDHLIDRCVEHKIEGVKPRTKKFDRVVLLDESSFLGRLRARERLVERGADE